MIFQPSKYKDKKILFNGCDLIFGNHKLERIHCAKYLGVLIDENLSWSDHIDCLTNKISSIIGIMYRNRHLLPLHCKKKYIFCTCLLKFDLLY